MIVLYATLSAFVFAVFFNVRGQKLIAAAIGGGFGWLFYELTVSHGVLMQYFVASAAIAIYAEVMARIQKAPITTYIAPALIPLVPGGDIYRAMLHALNGNNELFITVGIGALTVTGALTLGIVSFSAIIRLFTVHEIKQKAGHRVRVSHNDLYTP